MIEGGGENWEKNISKAILQEKKASTREKNSSPIFSVPPQIINSQPLNMVWLDGDSIKILIAISKQWNQNGVKESLKKKVLKLPKKPQEKTFK